jgi:hypothetical protein
MLTRVADLAGTAGDELSRNSITSFGKGHQVRVGLARTTYLERGVVPTSSKTKEHKVWVPTIGFVESSKFEDCKSTPPASRLEESDQLAGRSFNFCFPKATVDKLVPVGEFDL